MHEVKIDLALVNEKLGRIAAAGRNLAPVMRALREVMQDAVEQNFAQGGRPAWQGLSAKTLKRRPDRVGGKVLTDSARLRNSITAQSDRDTAMVGTNVKYAAIHQFGGTINHAARSGWVRHRTDAKGNLLRQGKNGRLLVFAKDSHKRVKVTRYTSEGWQVKMPARPFLVLTEVDASEMEATVSEYLATLV
ncbi:phage virion morphogenesis protein [Chitinimonas viridis]|uniref:Phage virion morphogenesis protein n=1 Tax=Chitinimonas viridis TaxID=664880 RepID=A0ABT8B9J4_9NEIS|nr:phage virion morphogenesis protein [Chitinimonas viridis]MDN3578704.1 phage virion morphogenesis protein [Chitinimonas viridis]